MRSAWFLAVALWSCLPGIGLAAPSIGLFTIVDGDAVVIRGTQKFAATEGLPVHADDIVHTAAATRIARIELTGGGALDLGPGTRGWLSPRFAERRSQQPLHLYLAQGWVKLTGSAAHRFGLASPRADLTDLAGVAVVKVADHTSFLFIEAGSATLSERLPGQVPRSRRLKEGEAFDRRSTDAGAVISRPAPDMIETMPRSFADSLPLRATRFQGTVVEPESPLDVGYADVAGWINAERALRPLFVQRFASLANDARFRGPLVAELASHPEWARVLFPEKVVRKRPAPPAAAVRPIYADPTAPLPARFAVTTGSVPTRSVRSDTDRDSLRPWEVRKR